MSEVVSMTGEPIIPPGTPNPAIIKDLEDLLERARSGEISAVAYAIKLRDGATAWFWLGAVDRVLLGALEIAKFRICQALTADE